MDPKQKSSRSDLALGGILLEVRGLLTRVDQVAEPCPYDAEIATLRGAFDEYLDAIIAAALKPCRSTGHDDKRRWCGACRKRMSVHRPLAPIERSPECVTPRCGQ